MALSDDSFLQQLRATFRDEAQEHLQALMAGLLDLEKIPAHEARVAIVDIVFRAAHSLKGAARAVDFTDIEALCQSVEDILASWKRGQTNPSIQALDLLHRKLDAISSILGTPVPSAPAQLSPRFSAKPVSTLAMPVAAPALSESTAETVRVPLARLESRLLEAEEMLGAKIAMGQRALDLRQLAVGFETWRRAWSAVEQDVQMLRYAALTGVADGEPGRARLQRVLDFCTWNEDTVRSIGISAAALSQAAQHDLNTVGKLVDELLANSKNMLLLPFATVAGSFSKLVRDLGRDQGKEVDFTIRGEQVEIDKRILEEIKDPLLHLLRNAVDHGVELPAIRKANGKQPRSTLTLTISQIDGNKVELLLSDDGAGIDSTKVKASAVKRGLISQDESARLDESEAQALIFQPEVSSSPVITELSGRGLGLAIACEKAAKLGGEISVQSCAGQGSTFRIVLPATRATFRGILLQAAGQLLVVPTAEVECVARVKAGDIKTVEGRETLSLGGFALALARLSDLLELPASSVDREAAGDLIVFVAGRGDQRVAFAVDAVLDEQEILAKPLRKPLSRVRNIAAATVLGSGQVAPILNIADLLKSARYSTKAKPHAVAATVPKVAHTILVAEDSITSRMLIKAILEAAGYHVKTAVDGMEAFALLRSESFDMLVSDVEMPRLNGFDLTARIRSDRKLAGLPVVLVTALETREDREHGIDVGANAYIVKGSFDQDNLIEAVRRLI